MSFSNIYQSFQCVLYGTDSHLPWQAGSIMLSRDVQLKLLVPGNWGSSMDLGTPCMGSALSVETEVFSSRRRLSSVARCTSWLWNRWAEPRQILWEGSYPHVWGVFLFTKCGFFLNNTVRSCDKKKKINKKLLLQKSHPKVYKCYIYLRLCSECSSQEYRLARGTFHCL